MAEVLIYNTTHWMDKLSQGEWNRLSKNDPNWQEKYAMRWQKDMVVERRPDGFWSKKGLYPRKDVFRVLLLPGVPEKDIDFLLEEGTSTRRKYKVASETDKEVATVSDIKNLIVNDSYTNQKIDHLSLKNG